jgi:hypothetical protein
MRLNDRKISPAIKVSAELIPVRTIIILTMSDLNLRSNLIT